ncbi:hypothetical protein GE21DRAFT_6973 [Neurospora crassa]|uniref:Uncharacterized protein n=1 Tax=Neurospora crassa (strain ATCC 24698 / 74-OR23-1A / CBS 708.71 / DSM 1257 / FGSC 987) TaxID=367110 RepID=V5IKZ7_NEUCR|nr:hypothetical protein NCU10184 [Neurospora crassa OR74A]ESA42373.1 hypothetical protein NCU10184 [Neurospora crassa OR74A]KHE81094.1 hypothetical protein GE21DRAFT_6973 [Neurospora crassa]|eukprot:XP_011394778.1 hypothetical protein NCU10184 [Neurospora crassa OR74A]
MSNDRSWFVLTKEDARGLQEYGLLNLNHEIGYHELHKGCFLSHNDLSHALRRSPAKPSDMLKIPMIIISREALIWLGFSNKMADQLWQQWLYLHSNRRPGIFEFRDVILTYFRLPDVADEPISLLAHKGRPDKDEDEVPDFYTAKDLPYREPVLESTFLAGLRGPPDAPPCACTVRKDSERRTTQDHLILYKVVTGTQLKNIRVSSSGNLGPVGLSNIDSLVEVSREPEREPFLYNNVTGDGDPQDRVASVMPRRRAHKRADLVFFTCNPEHALAKYKWAVHRLDKRVGAVDAAKFAGGADVQILEIRISMDEMEYLRRAMLAYHIPYSSASNMVAFLMWQEMVFFSRLKELARSKFPFIEAIFWRVWTKLQPEIQEARRSAGPTLRAIQNDQWFVLCFSAVRRRGCWNYVSMKLAEIVEKGTVTSSKPTTTAPPPTSTSNKNIPTSASSSAPLSTAANNGPAPDEDFMSANIPYTREEYVFNVSTYWGNRWFLTNVCYFETYKLISEEITTQTDEENIYDLEDTPADVGAEAEGDDTCTTTV